MSKGVKNFLFSLLDHSGTPELALALQRQNRGFIVLYHGIAPNVPDYGIYNYRKKFILPENFRAHLSWFQSHFEIVTLSTLIERFLKGVKSPRRYLAITFDDGYENIYRYAFPLLKEFGIPATVFITTDLVEKRFPLWVDRLEYALGHTELPKIEIELGGHRHSFRLGNLPERTTADIYLRNNFKKTNDVERRTILEKIESCSGTTLVSTLETSPYRGLEWDQILTMAENKIEFAPHTMSHPILTRMPPEQAEEEIIESYRLLKKRIGNPLPIFAYPNGQSEDFSPETAAILQRHGFQAALTTIPGTINQMSRPFALPRFSLDGSDDLRFLRLTISGIRKKMQDIRSWYRW
jgi:peptidoglycan/xylan/chitin deacetylase (PgdA/CDA1 family)